MLEPLDRSRRNFSLNQFTTKPLRDFIDPYRLPIQIDEQQFPASGRSGAGGWGGSIPLVSHRAVGVRKRRKVNSPDRRYSSGGR